MVEYIVGLGVTFLTLILSYIAIDVILPIIRNSTKPKSSSLIFYPCPIELSYAGDGEDGNSEEQFNKVLQHLRLSDDSEVTILEEN